jgi:transposase InsO family protein
MEIDVLARIREFRDEVGTDVSEDIITDLIRQEGELSSSGFRFLRLSEGFAVFTVPRQQMENWYRQRGWPAPSKENIVRRVAEKYGLELNEPPDQNTLVGECHHHFEMWHLQKMLIVAHPRYLKIRVGKSAVRLESGVMDDLAALYGDVAVRLPAPVGQP